MLTELYSYITSNACPSDAASVKAIHYASWKHAINSSNKGSSVMTVSSHLPREHWIKSQIVISVYYRMA